MSNWDIYDILCINQTKKILKSSVHSVLLQSTQQTQLKCIVKFCYRMCPIFPQVICQRKTSSYKTRLKTFSNEKKINIHSWYPGGMMRSAINSLSSLCPWMARRHISLVYVITKSGPVAWSRLKFQHHGQPQAFTTSVYISIPTINQTFFQWTLCF